MAGVDVFSSPRRVGVSRVAVNTTLPFSLRSVCIAATKRGLAESSAREKSATFTCRFINTGSFSRGLQRPFVRSNPQNRILDKTRPARLVGPDPLRQRGPSAARRRHKRSSRARAEGCRGDRSTPRASGERRLGCTRGLGQRIGSGQARSELSDGCEDRSGIEQPNSR